MTLTRAKQGYCSSENTADRAMTRPYSFPKWQDGKLNTQSEKVRRSHKNYLTRTGSNNVEIITYYKYTIFTCSLRAFVYIYLSAANIKDPLMHLKI